MPLAKIRVATSESIIAHFIIFAASLFATFTDPFAMGIVIEDIIETNHDGSITQHKNKIDLRQNSSHESALNLVFGGYYHGDTGMFAARL